MGIDSIRKAYGVPAKVGGRIVYTNASGRSYQLKITGVNDSRRLRCAGPGIRFLIHPADPGIQYL